MTRGKSCFKQENDKVRKKSFLFFFRWGGRVKVNMNYVKWEEKGKEDICGKKNFDNCYGCPRRNFEKTAVYSQATKNNRFSSKIII